MKRYTVLIFLIVSLLSQSLLAQNKTRFSVAPSVKYNFGYTEYVMDLIYYDSDDDEHYRLKSELVFPLDVIMPGVNIGVQSSLNDKIDWSVFAEVYFSANNPSSKMTDRDWEGPVGGQLIEFSNTESDAELSAFKFNLRAEKQVLSKSNFDLYLVLGYEYQKFDYDIYGYRGWQINDVGARQNMSDDTVKALDYEVTYSMPLFGLAARFNQTGRTVLNINTEFGPVFVSDLDDHVLRNKIAEASGTGFAVGASGNSRFFFNIGSRPRRAFFDLNADIKYISASTKQTQKWYGDDPATVDDDTGSYITNIPHDIKSLQYGIGVKIGMMF